jgi:hypothetical protein
MSITVILNQFLLQTAVGMLFLCLFLPKDSVDRYFFKSIGFFSYLFIGGALFLRWKYALHLPEMFQSVGAYGLDRAQQAAPLHYYFSNILIVAVALCAFITWFIIRFLPEEKKFAFWINCAAVISIPAVIVDSLLFIPTAHKGSLIALLVPLQFVTASLVLGGFLVGMIFGHWYLIYTNMPKRLMVRTSKILIGTILFRSVAVGITLLALDSISKPDENILHIITSFKGYGVFFWTRLSIGLVIPMITSYMIWSTSRLGANQSATGILYVAVAFIFIGELMAKFLFLFSTIPL